MNAKRGKHGSTVHETEVRDSRLTGFQTTGKQTQGTIRGGLTQECYVNPLTIGYAAATDLSVISPGLWM